MPQKTPGKPKKTLAETRTFLAQVAKHPRLIDEVGDCALDDKEVARFIARKAKTLFLVASHTNQERLQKLSELLFYTAYLCARMKDQESLTDSIDWRELLRNSPFDLDRLSDDDEVRQWPFPAETTHAAG